MSDRCPLGYLFIHVTVSLLAVTLAYYCLLQVFSVTIHGKLVTEKQYHVPTITENLQTITAVLFASDF